MFVPIEAAYLTACRATRRLFSDAWRPRCTSWPRNADGSLKLIEGMWVYQDAGVADKIAEAGS